MAHINLTREARCGARRRPAPTSLPSCCTAARRSAQPLVPGAADRALPAAGGAGDEPRDVGRIRPQRSFAQLRADSATVLGPAAGDQACGEIGDGRMLEPRTAFENDRLPAQRRCWASACSSPPADLPSRSARCVASNLSSGKMGFAIARARHRAGAEVTLVAGPVHLPDAAPRAPHRRAHRAADARCGAAGGCASRRLRRHRHGGRLAPANLRAQDQKDGKARAELRADQKFDIPSPRWRAGAALVGFAAEPTC